MKRSRQKIFDVHDKDISHSFPSVAFPGCCSDAYPIFSPATRESAGVDREGAHTPPRRRASRGSPRDDAMPSAIPLPSIATTRGTPSCSATADSACPARLVARVSAAANDRSRSPRVLGLIIHPALPAPDRARRLPPRRRAPISPSRPPSSRRASRVHFATAARVVFRSRLPGTVFGSPSHLRCKQTPVALAADSSS